MRRIGDLIDAFRPADGPPPDRLWPFMRWALSGAWRVLMLAGVLSAVAGAMEAITAVILGWVIDLANSSARAEFFDAQNWPLLIGAVVFFLIVRPLAFAVSSTANSVVVGPNVMPLVLGRLNRWTLGQGIGFFDDDFAGRIAQKQLQVSNSLTEVAVEVINVVAFALASLLGALVVLGAIDGWMVLVFAVWLLAYGALIRFFLPRIRARAAARAGARAQVTGQLVDAITNIRTVKLFAHGKREDGALIGELGRFREVALGFGRLAAGFRFLLMVIAGALPVLMVGGAIIAWQAGGATAGDIVAAGVVSIRVAQMTGWVSFSLMGIYAHIGEVEDGMRTLAPPVRLRDGARALEVATGEIVFDDVSFAYGRDSGGVADIALRVRAGEKLGIVGASGAGKSTLVALLLRLYDPERGTITIDGQDLRDVSLHSLRRAIGMVTQETALFNRSARENILYGQPDASEEEMRAAARKAEADEFIEGLEDGAGRKGYGAHLGERGVKLSGGQRQRIALARAILKDAPILVLDEATSALDSEVEAAIQSALERVMEGKTVLAIAHRLSTIAQMDRIVVLDEGKIAEIGSHDELLAAGGIYAGLWAHQSGGFIGKAAAE